MAKTLSAARRVNGRPACRPKFVSSTAAARGSSTRDEQQRFIDTTDRPERPEDAVPAPSNISVLTVQGRPACMRVSMQTLPVAWWWEHPRQSLQPGSAATVPSALLY